MADIFLKPIVKMQEFVRKHDAPFIAKIYKSGKIEMWKDHQTLLEELEVQPYQYKKKVETYICNNENQSAIAEFWCQYYFSQSLREKFPQFVFQVNKASKITCQKLNSDK